MTNAHTDRGAYKQWLRTDEGMKWQAKNLRYKRGALNMLQWECLTEELYEIQEKAEELFWALKEDEGLLNAVDGDEDDLSEFAFQFSDLANKCENLSETLQSYGGCIRDHFDDFFVGITGGRFDIVGYDVVEADYFSLCGFSGELASEESAKRLAKLTKADLLEVAGRCFGVAIAILDILKQFESLNAAIYLMKGQHMLLLEDIEDVLTAYEAAAKDEFKGDANKRLEGQLWSMPDKVWLH